MYDVTSIEPASSSFSEFDVPVNLLPDLSEWGIVDAVSRGVCPNTFENRTIIRDNKARYREVYTPEGEPTNLISVITGDMIEANRTSNKSALLTDPDNPDSDFHTEYDLLMDDMARELAPQWVVAATRQWIKVLEERERRGPDGKPYRPALATAPTRCLATTGTGARCWNWTNGATEYNGFCKMHISNHQYDPEAGANTVTKARNRLLSATIGAVDELERLMTHATSEPVRAQAAKEILDRAGIRGGIEVEQKVEIQVVPASQVVSDRLAKLAEGAREREKLEAARYALESSDSEDTVDAEVIEE